MLEALILSLAFVWLSYWVFRRKPRLSYIPGPRGWPLIGNIRDIKKAGQLNALTEWAKQYGSIFVVRTINDNWVFLNSYDSIIEMLVTKGSHYAGRSRSYRTRLRSQNFRGITFKHDLAALRPLKKAALAGMKTYTKESRSRMENLLLESVDDFLTMLSKRGEQSFDIGENFYNFSIKSILTILVGRRIDEADPAMLYVREMARVSAKSSIFSGAGYELDMLPWLRYFGNTAYKNILKGFSLVDTFWNVVFPDLKARFDANERICLAHHLMETISRETFGEDYSQEVKVTSRDLVVAGSLSTTKTLYAFFNILLHYPTVKRRIQEEIDREIGQSRRVRLEDKISMPYTQATLLELLRFTTIPHLGIPHCALTTSTIRGYRIPAGTNVVVNAFFLHHDESFWKDPWNFRPERFLDGSGKLVEPDHDNRRHLIAFGAGPRVCPGEALAMARIFLLATSILQRFDVLPDDSSPLVECDPRTYEAALGLTPRAYALKMLQRFSSTVYK